ncbi:hypothetical protein G3N58_18090 [Paraburkholderia sp. Ac-20342]|uniref:hypothetical protein n=1 Tax=Paraburkholderia sp. Ac-20342 TaxID=2703889 RepID=UPI00198075D6|nr:hypothetical protein [Paraburkholderia sp. Ac-20342]MBN3848721.1 hypothetical protein [Paraburkholderia sp. Ac-20342]
MGIFGSWSQALVGKPWIRLDDAGIVLAGGSPRTGARRGAEFEIDKAHWLSLVVDAIARGVIAATEHDNTRYVRQADLRRWCEASGTPWKIPHHAGEDEPDPPKQSAASAEIELSSAGIDQAEPRERTSLLILIAAAARAKSLDAAALEQATQELGTRLSRRTIHKYLAAVRDVLERRGGERD